MEKRMSQESLPVREPGASGARPGMQEVNEPIRPIMVPAPPPAQK